MLILMFLHHLLMLHLCYSHRHACTPSSLLQPDRSHTQPEYNHFTILEVVVIMGGEESQPTFFILCNYRAIMEVSSSDDQSTSAKCTVRDIQKSSQMCIRARDSIFEVLPHINVYLSTRWSQNIGFPGYAWTGFFWSKMDSIFSTENIFFRSKDG